MQPGACSRNRECNHPVTRIFSGTRSALSEVAGQRSLPTESAKDREHGPRNRSDYAKPRNSFRFPLRVPSQQSQPSVYDQARNLSCVLRLRNLLPVFTRDDVHRAPTCPTGSVGPTARNSSANRGSHFLRKSKQACRGGDGIHLATAKSSCRALFYPVRRFRS